MIVLLGPRRRCRSLLLVVGGTIPKRDVRLLEEAGAAAVFPTGTALETMVESLRALSAAQTPL